MLTCYVAMVTSNCRPSSSFLSSVPRSAPSEEAILQRELWSLTSPATTHNAPLSAPASSWSESLSKALSDDLLSFPDASVPVRPQSVPVPQHAKLLSDPFTSMGLKKKGAHFWMEDHKVLLSDGRLQDGNAK